MNNSSYNITIILLIAAFTRPLNPLFPSFFPNFGPPGRGCCDIKVLTEAYRRHGKAGGMPRPPRFVVVQENEALQTGTNGIVPTTGIAFPVICKPIEACGELRMD